MRGLWDFLIFFNSGLIVGNPLAKLPYNGQLKHPSAMTNDELRYIFNNIDKIDIIGMCTEVSFANIIMIISSF